MTTNLTYAVGIQQFFTNRPNGSFDADAYAELVATAERLGYQHLLLADHVFIPPYWSKVIGDFYLDPFDLLSYVAAKTSTIELVVACLVVPYRQPFGVAKSVATVDQLSNGRFALGVVPGYLKEEFEAFGLPLDERNAMTNEFVRIMIELWDNDNASFEGKYYSFKDVTLKPKCVQSPHVPIWIGGSSQQAIKRVAEFGDVWHPLGFTVIDDTYMAANRDELAGKALPTSGTTPDRLASGLERIRQLAADAGRDISHLRVIAQPGLPGEEGEGKGPAGSGALEIALGGQRVIDWLGKYKEAGATGIVVTPPGFSKEECIENLERFAAEVMPVL